MELSPQTGLPRAAVSTVHRYQEGHCGKARYRVPHSRAVCKLEHGAVTAKMMDAGPAAEDVPAPAWNQETKKV